MSQPPKGHYRSILGERFPNVRIAFTHTPIHGCTRVSPDPILGVLDESSDQYAKWYADGIRNGSLVTITPMEAGDVVFRNNGELFFRS
jgi:hypothetical protein